MSFIQVSKGGESIYFKQIYTTKVLVLDSRTGDVKRSVEMDQPIARMNTDPYGNLYVRLIEKGKKKVRVIDKGGYDVPARLPVGIIDHILAIKDGRAYWKFYDFENDDLVLGSCLEIDITKFAQAHAG